MDNHNYTTMRHIEIDAAHRVPLHASKCKNVHGHRYKIEAYVTGSLAKEGSEEGMTMDFGFIKEELSRKIAYPCDHGMILQFNDPILQLLIPNSWEPLVDLFKDTHVVWQPLVLPNGFRFYFIRNTPTAENLAAHWYGMLERGIKERTQGRALLTRIRVWETPNCWAEYPADTSIVEKEVRGSGEP